MKGAGRTARRAIVVVGLVLWIGLPVVLVRQIREEAAGRHLRAVRPTLVVVRAAPAVQEEPIGLHLVWVPLPPAVAPAWTGLVDAVTVQPGSVVHDGDSPISIDQSARTLIAGHRPFTRPLGYPAVGADVADLNAFLARHGYRASQGDRFGGETEQGVKAFATDHALPASGLFLPEWAIFLPAPSATVSGVSASVGSPAPAAGSSLLTFRAGLTAVRLIAPQDDTSDGAPPTDTTPATDAAGEPAGSSGGPDAGTAEQARLSRLPAVSASGGATVDLDGTTLRLAPDRRSLGPASVARLSRQDDASTPYVRATLHTKRAAGQFVVPTAAVFADPQSPSMCVVARTGRHESSVPVVVVDDDEGTAIVSGRLSARSRVVVGVTGARRRCG